MNSYLTEDFLECFRRLPQEIKEKARRNYHFWKQNPNHPSLQFKRVHTREPIYAVRVGIGWRVLGLREDDTIYWFWIGPHDEYEKLLDQL
ncbi:MAG: hypothetical protein OXH39_21075 [Candidatus Poribacteria bacterium]|nr:hypothetical protein [Candidatus Poribacteria bacterium]